MTTSPAGWYPDPAGSGGLRWWDGAGWGEHVQPAPQPAGAAPAQQWGAQPQQQWAAQPQFPGAQPWGAQQAPAGFATRNTNSLVVGAIALVYVVLAATVHVVVLGFLPVLFAVRAVQAKEPLAWPAVGVAVAVLVFAFVEFV